MPVLNLAAVPGAVSTVSTQLEAVYAAHSAAVARWALRLGGPGFDAEDAVQEVFAIVAERLSEFRGDSKLETWLYGITENVVRAQRRRDRLRRWFFGDLGDEEPASAELLAPELLERREADRLVYRVLDRLREPYRSTLILFELEELSGEAIAELKQVKVATVWVWLHRARKQFVKQFTRLARST